MALLLNCLLSKQPVCKAVQSFMRSGDGTVGRGSPGSLCLGTFLQQAPAVCIRGRLSVYKRLRLLVVKEPGMEAFANGQNLPLRTQPEANAAFGMLFNMFGLLLL